MVTNAVSFTGHTAYVVRNKLCMNEDNEELCDQHSSPDIIWMIKKSVEEMDSQGMAHMGDRSVYRVLVERPDGSKPLGSPRRRWEGTIKIDLHEVGGGHGLD